jgi:hypothetical protein
MVNNAGITRDRRLTSSSEQDFDATIAVREWTADADYSSRSGGALTAEELVNGTASLFGTMPTGVTSLNKS